MPPGRRIDERKRQDAAPVVGSEPRQGGGFGPRYLTRQAWEEKRPHLGEASIRSNMDLCPMILETKIGWIIINVFGEVVRESNA